MQVSYRARQALIITCGLTILILLIHTLRTGTYEKVNAYIANSYHSFGTQDASDPLRHAQDQQNNTLAVWEFSHSLLKLLRDSEPPVDIHRDRSANLDIFFESSKDTELPPFDLIDMTKHEVTAMRQAHELFLLKARKISGWVPYEHGTRGIVITAGAKQFPMLLVSLRLLRKTGCKLPIELFISESDQVDAESMCAEELAVLGAQCVVLEKFIPPCSGEECADTITLEKYQYKIFSMLFSKFEQLLLLDADNILLHDPELEGRNIFTSEPFASSGLVTWPDYWIRTASPHFYAVQDLPIPPSNDRASTESGQLLVNKRTHSLALLLATYYNYYGPSHFYSLQTQGGNGEGDKETFVAAAKAIPTTFYQVNKMSEIIHPNDGDHSANKNAMLQFNPVDDFRATQGSVSDAYAEEADETASLTPFAVHANWPKLDPQQLLEEDDRNLKDATPFRLWGDMEIVRQATGRDLELEAWQEMRYVACEIGHKFKSWHPTASSEGVVGTCERVQQHMDAIFS